HALVERALEREVERSGARAIPDAEDLVEEGDEGSVRQHDQLVPDRLRDRARIVEHARRLPARTGVGGPGEHGGALEREIAGDALWGDEVAGRLPPPFRLTPATSPRDPPSDQRSCCQKATMLFGFVGFTSTQGSTSELRKTFRCPVGSRAICPATSSAVQLANGLVPETWTSAPVMKGPAR